MTRDEFLSENPLPGYLRNRGFELHPAGPNFVTSICPVTTHKGKFHRPTTIDTSKNLWHCNDCKQGGTIFDWEAIENKISISDAQRKLGFNPNGDKPRLGDAFRQARDAMEKIVATYDYTDEDGKLLFQCVRYQPKDFRQRRPDGKGGWIRNIKGVRRVLYHLPEVIKSPIACIAEGEKDCDRLASLGFTATCNVGGAEKWRDEYSQALRGKDLVIFYDRDQDEKGKRHRDQITQSLRGLAKSIKLPELPAGFHDVSDYIESLQPNEATGIIAELADNTPEIVVETREQEKSWKNALNESVVTSRELRDLALTPRRKLLGDWFAEGDLGFIFAFRGVGKTWFGVYLAEALSTGGKVGDWQAHECVRVLLVDGEMPPDLMRDRSKGLESAPNANLAFVNHEILFERSGKVLNITRPEVQQAITQLCVDTKVKVLILDNLSTLASGMRENEADSWELVNNWLLDLRRRKIAVVIIHHAGRSGEMRGTSKREDNVFWIIALDDAKKDADDKRGARFISRFTKQSRNTQDDVAAYELAFRDRDFDWRSKRLVQARSDARCVSWIDRTRSHRMLRDSRGNEDQ